MFLEQCRLLVGAAERGQEVAGQASAGLLGILHVGVEASAFSEVLPQILRRFRESRPLVEFCTSRASELAKEYWPSRAVEDELLMIRLAEEEAPTL